MDEKQIEKEFYETVNVYGASTKLGLTRSQLGNIKRSPTIKTMLYVLYLANKLELKDGPTTKKG